MKRFLFGAILVTMVATSVQAVAFGPRIGLTSDPDQFIFGGSFDAGYLADHVRIRPVIQAGFGDDIFTLLGAGAVHYEFGNVGGEWRPYAGGELELVYYNIDLPDGASGDDDDTEFGIAAAGGIEKTLSSGNVLQLELRLGLMDEVPDLQFHIGWSFFGRHSGGR